MFSLGVHINRVDIPPFFANGSASRSPLPLPMNGEWREFTRKLIDAAANKPPAMNQFDKQ